jgi:dTDP-glucose 4,6-dehydratase
MHKRLLVTGGSGFIGSAFIRYGLKNFPWIEKIVNLDLLTYAGNEKNCADIAHDPRYLFVRGDICNQALVQTLCEQHQIDAIVHSAAETHVDRSIAGPEPFIETNIKGTYALLEVVRRLPHIHFHHISTDEVYGSTTDGHFHEKSHYQPSSPYSASKAASDHLVRAWAHTFGLSTTISHCSNNYGPYQYPEKLIPHMLFKLLENKPLPVYGQGINVRDWLYVYDHAEALWTILSRGKKGEVYNIGGECEMKNIDMLHLLIKTFAAKTKKNPQDLEKLITFVPDRLGHDLRYAIDCSKIKTELGWSQRHTFANGLEETVDWYLERV